MACAGVTCACAVAVLGALLAMAPGGLVLERDSEHLAQEQAATVDGTAAGSEAPQAEAQASDEGQTSGEAPAVDGAASPASQPALVCVHVDGAVASPGVYRLEGTDLRIADAVEAAGGLLAEADTSTVNLAAPLADGAKVHVPVAGEDPVQPEGAATATGASTITDASTTQPAVPALVNINTASAEELCQLSGVGEATAQAIIKEREANGPFVSKEDIMRVSGIGEKKFARIEADICV